MKVTDVYIRRCRWWVRIYYAVTCYHTNRILHDLESLDCNKEIYRKAKRHLIRGDLDTGLTYTNKQSRKSLVVVGLSSSQAQFLNSFEHELRHLVDDITEACGADTNGEEVAYLTGDLNALLFEDVHSFICCSHNCKCNRHGGV